MRMTCYVEPHVAEKIENLDLPLELADFLDLDNIQYSPLILSKQRTVKLTFGVTKFVLNQLNQIMDNFNMNKTEIFYTMLAHNNHIPPLEKNHNKTHFTLWLSKKQNESFKNKIHSPSKIIKNCVSKLHSTSGEVEKVYAAGLMVKERMFRYEILITPEFKELCIRYDMNCIDVAFTALRMYLPEAP